MSRCGRSIDLLAEWKAHPKGCTATHGFEDGYIGPCTDDEWDIVQSLDMIDPMFRQDKTERLAAAARALLESYDTSCPDWWPPAMDDLREALAEVDPPFEGPKFVVDEKVPPGQVWLGIDPAKDGSSFVMVSDGFNIRVLDPSPSDFGQNTVRMEGTETFRLRPRPCAGPEPDPQDAVADGHPLLGESSMLGGTPWGETPPPLTYERFKELFEAAMEGRSPDA